MKIAHISTDARELWDALTLREPYFALMQSWDWGEYKRSLGWQVYRIAVMEADNILAGAQMFVRKAPGNFAGMAYIPRGPIGDWHNEPVASMLWNEIHLIACRTGSIFLKIEPAIQESQQVVREFQNRGFIASCQTNQPRSTLILDLTPGPEKIRLNMRKSTRSYIRSAISKGVTLKHGSAEDLQAFYELMRQTAYRDQFTLRSFDYYAREWKAFDHNNQAALLMAYSQDKLLAVRIIYRFGKHAAEFHACSSGEHLDLHPNHFLVWQGIQWAYDSGCRTYDLWGIPDEVGEIVYAGSEPPVDDRTDGLWGVYRFKTGFCKNIVYYTGAHDFVYHPFLYRVMNGLPLGPQAFERIAARLDVSGK